MAEIGKWNRHTFIVSPTLIRSFNGLTLKGSSETGEKTSGSQKYVTRKSGAPLEVSLTVQLNAATGCDVRNEAKQFVADARSGAKDYFYIGGTKLLACKLMLTEASVTETEIAPGGKWVSCSVKLTMKQASKSSGSSGSGGNSGSKSNREKKSGSKKVSVRKKKTTTTSKTSNAIVAGSALGAVTGIATALKKAVSNGIQDTKKRVQQARSASATSKQKSSTSQKIIPIDRYDGYSTRR